MVKQSIIVGIGVSIALMLAVIILAIVKYRKKEFIISAILWGVMTLFIYNAFGTLINGAFASVLFDGNESYTAFMNDENRMLLAALYATVVAVIALMGTAIVVITVQKKRGKVNEHTAEMTGMFSGIFQWINPAQGIMMYLVNMLIYSLAINSGDSILSPSETVTQQQIDDLVNSIVNSSWDFYVRVALMYIALTLIYRAIFKLVDRSLEKKEGMIGKLMLTALAFSVSYFVLQVLSVDSIWYGFALLGVVIVGVGITYVVDRTKFLKS